MRKPNWFPTIVAIVGLAAGTLIAPSPIAFAQGPAASATSGTWRIVVAEGLREPQARDLLEVHASGGGEMIPTGGGLFTVFRGRFATQAEAEAEMERLVNDEGLVFREVRQEASSAPGPTETPSLFQPGGTDVIYRVLVASFDTAMAAEDFRNELAANEGFLLETGREGDSYHVYVSSPTTDRAAAEGVAREIGRNARVVAEGALTDLARGAENLPELPSNLSLPTAADQAGRDELARIREEYLRTVLRENQRSQWAQDIGDLLNQGNWQRAHMLVNDWELQDPGYPAIATFRARVEAARAAAPTANQTGLTPAPPPTSVTPPPDNDVVIPSSSGDGGSSFWLLIVAGIVLLVVIGAIIFVLKGRKPKAAPPVPSVGTPNLPSSVTIGGGLHVGSHLMGGMTPTPAPMAKATPTPTPSPMKGTSQTQTPPPAAAAGSAAASATDRIRPGVVFPAGSTPGGQGRPASSPAQKAATPVPSEPTPVPSSDEGLKLDDIFSAESPVEQAPQSTDAIPSSASNMLPDKTPQHFTSPPSGVQRTPNPDEYYIQEFDDEEVGAMPRSWKGEYEYASLSVAERGDGQGRCMRFEKKKGSGSAYYACRFPDASGRVAVEFDLKCEDKNKYLLGFYIEKDEDFRHSVHTVVHKDASKSDKVSLRLQNEAAPYALGEWVHIKFLIDLPRHLVDGYVNDKPVAIGVRLVSRPKVINTLSIRDNLATEGVLMIDNIRIYRDR